MPCLVIRDRCLQPLKFAFFEDFGRSVRCLDPLECDYHRIVHITIFVVADANVNGLVIVVTSVPQRCAIDACVRVKGC